MKNDKIKTPVKYDNSLNRVNVGSLNAMEQNLLFAIICGMFGKTKIIFDIDCLRRLASGSSTMIRKERMPELVDGIINKVFHKYVTDIVGNKIINIHLFRAMNILLDKDKNIAGLEVIVDEEAVEIFARKSGNLTIVDFDRFVSIRSSYIKGVFRLLSQFKSTGYAKFDYSEFLDVIGCPDTYKQEDIKRRILEPSVLMISDYFKGLKYKLIKENKYGYANKIKWIEFRFKKIFYKKAIDVKIEGLEKNVKSELFYLNCGLKAISNLDKNEAVKQVKTDLRNKMIKIIKEKGA